MKFLNLLLFTFLFSSIWSQESEDFIPKDAVSVFSINNVALLQKVSLDELIQYEFMEELQTELFDGSTNGKTLKDSGIDFTKKLNVFYGKSSQFEVSGFTFGISDKTKLFDVFDDFDKQESKIKGIEFYASLQNQLIIKGNIAVLMRVEPLSSTVREYADSLWSAKGYGAKNYYDNGYYGEDEMVDFIGHDEHQESVLSEEEFDADELDSLIYVEETPLEEAFPKATENPHVKNYSEFKDSVLVMYQVKFLSQICKELFIENINLKSVDSKFADQLSHNSEGTFYLDNSKNLKNTQNFWYFQSIFPKLYNEINELYSGNIIVGDLYFNENSIDFKLEANYGEALGSIYEKLNNSKLDKSILNYIHENSAFHFTYNVNLREAYEQSFKVVVPILEKQKDPRVSSTLLTLELLNDFVNKDALFGTYTGTMFGTFNGIQKVKTTKIDYEYDEETFEYTETEVEGEEEMPLFTFGISTERSDVPDKILKHISGLTSKLKNHGKYWKFENALFESVPLYFINRNGLFIVTNDESLAINNADGYGDKALSKKAAKKIKKGGVVYAYVDWTKMIDKLPREVFQPKQLEIMDAVRTKTGIMELTSDKINKTKMNFQLKYSMNEKSGNSAKHILDIINSVYVLSK